MSTISTITKKQSKGTEQTRIWYDCERRETISEAITHAACEHKSCEVNELPPLSEYADPDALNALFGEDNPSPPPIAQGTLGFQYDDLVVEITTAGTVEIQDL